MLSGTKYKTLIRNYHPAVNVAWEGNVGAMLLYRYIEKPPPLCVGAAKQGKRLFFTDITKHI